MKPVHFYFQKISCFFVNIQGWKIQIIKTKNTFEITFDTVFGNQNLKGFIKNLTWFKSWSGSTIDLILTNNSYLYQKSQFFETGFSDHPLICAMFKRKFERIWPKIITYQSHKIITYRSHKIITYRSHKIITYRSHKIITYRSHKIITYRSHKIIIYRSYKKFTEEQFKEAIRLDFSYIQGGNLTSDKK